MEPLIVSGFWRDKAKAIMLSERATIINDSSVAQEIMTDNNWPEMRRPGMELRVKMNDNELEYKLHDSEVLISQKEDIRKKTEVKKSLNLPTRSRYFRR